MGKVKVSIVKTNSNPEYPEIRETIKKALDLIDGIGDVIKRGDLVLINPSWVARYNNRCDVVRRPLPWNMPGF